MTWSPEAAQRIDVTLVSLTRALARGGIQPARDEALALMALCGIGSIDFLRAPETPLTAKTRDELARALALRLAGMPPGRIGGRKPFFGLPLAIGPEVLEPRADTETLVEAVLPFLERTVARKGMARVLDIGTGSGAIGLALCSHVPRALVRATDIQRGAVATANRNARSLGLAKRFRACRADLMPPLRPAGGHDLIVSNPPYIRSGVIPGLAREVRHHDPRLALDGGPDGLMLYRRMALHCASGLAPNGRLAVEIGHDQRLSVTGIFEQAGWHRIGAHQDLGGRDRVLVFAIKR